MVEQSHSLKTRRLVSNQKLSRLHRFEHFLVSQLGIDKAQAKVIAPKLDSTLDEALFGLNDLSSGLGTAKSQ